MIFKRKPQEEPDYFVNRPFKIHQIPKITGLKQKGSFEKTQVVSPHFGTKVKDEIVLPPSEKAKANIDKKYDSFRIQPKLTEEEKYSEFDTISNDTRKEVFGSPVYEKEEPKEVEIDSDNPFYGFETKNVEVETEPKEAPSWLTQEIEENNRINNEDQMPTVANLEPIKKVEEPVIIKQEPLQTTAPKTYDEPKEESDNPFIVQNPVTQVSGQSEIEKTKPIVKEEPKKPYKLPPVSLFKKTQRDQDAKPEWLVANIDLINETLKNHGVDGEVHATTKGPTVTRYEIELKPGVNVKRVSAIQDNLMMALSAKSIRIEAPIPGKAYVGIEVANKVPETVSFGNVVDTKEFLEDSKPLKIALGVDIDGKNIYEDIAKMPHGLVAGATNSGKSVCVNTILASLLIKNSPDDLKLILVDPKMVELTPYNDLPHLVTPVITDPKLAASALSWAVDEMEKRYKTFADNRARNIEGFNESVAAGRVDLPKMPYLLIIIDELADLMMVAPGDVEDAIKRITQKARAAGIHLLVATQRPTTDVVKGTIKSNIPYRIAFKVASFVDSTTILDGAGAETLLGRGDMLIRQPDRTIRLQGAYIPDDEIYAITDYIRSQQEPCYIFEHDKLKKQIEKKEIEIDEQFDEVAVFVVQSGKASINVVSQEFGMGFNRASKVMTQLENYQIVSAPQGTKPREVLVSMSELEDILNKMK